MARTKTTEAAPHVEGQHLESTGSQLPESSSSEIAASATVHADGVVDPTHAGQAAATVSPVASPMSAADFIDEILADASAAKNALEHVRHSPTPESVLIPEDADPAVREKLSEEDAQKLLEKRKAKALKERTSGLLRLTTVPTRLGEMVLTRTIEVGDVAIANMVSRFVYTTDRFLNRIHGYGATILGERKAEEAIEIMSGQVDELHRNGKTLLAQTKQALITYKGSLPDEDDWVEAVCINKAMQVEVHLLRREGNRFLEAFIAYDKAISNMKILDMNYGTDSDLIADELERLRKASYKIYRTALSGQIEFGRKLDTRKKDKEGSSAPPAPRETPASTGTLVES